MHKTHTNRIDRINFDQKKKNSIFLIINIIKHTALLETHYPKDNFHRIEIKLKSAFPFVGRLYISSWGN